MRILIATDPIGGVWTYSKELSAELLASGNAVALVSFGRIPSAAQLDWVGSQVSRWGGNFRFAASDAPLEWMRENCRAYAEAEPLLLRVAGEFGAELLVSGQYCFGALRCDLPRVVVAHREAMSRSRVCRNGPLPLPAWLERYRLLAANGLREAHGLVAPTEWMLGALATHFYLPTRVRVIPHGRTLDPPHASSCRRLQAIAAGRFWDEAKNLKLLGEIDPPMPVLVAGEIEPEPPRLSLRLPRSFGKATLLGPLDEREMLALFRQSAVYICTSQYESFGMAPLEAALCGCALVANDIPSLREVWQDAVNYFEDAESLSALLAKLRDDRQFLQQSCAAAQRRARQLTGKRMADAYLDLFHSIVQPVARAEAAERCIA